MNTLGRTIVVDASANVINCSTELNVRFLKPSVEVIIGIGNDHTAHLLMDEEAYQALNSGEPIRIDRE